MVVPCSILGGPLMHRHETTGLWRIIGTVYGGGYLCGKGKVAKVFGTTDGLWSSVPAQLDWVKKVMAEYNTECRAGYNIRPTNIRPFVNSHAIVNTFVFAINTPLSLF